MKRIGILSDTHGFLHPRIEAYLKNTDLILHAGDLGNFSVLENLKKIQKTYAVYGNIDGTDIRNTCKEYVVLEVEAKKILMIHIGGYPGRYTPKARKLIQQHQPDLFISGHSHILKVMPDKKNNLLHINPGASGRSGFHKKFTAIRLIIDSNTFKDLEVLEIDRKA